MAYGSQNNRGDQTDLGLDALTNPFKLAGRVGQGAVSSVDDMLRGLARAGGAILSDVIAEPVRGLVPGGDPGWWINEETGGRRISTYDDLLKPVGLSFANTVDTLGDLAYVPNLFMGGTERANEQFGDRLQQLNDDPFNFALEHVGNAALVGGLVAKPAQLGIASSRGAVTGAQAAQGLRPMAGRGVRRTAREATQEAAAEGSRAARAAMISDDIVAHPYRSAVRGVKGSRAAQLIREPRAFDPVTKVGQTLNNLGGENFVSVPSMSEAVSRLDEIDLEVSRIDSEIEGTLRQEFPDIDDILETSASPAFEAALEAGDPDAIGLANRLEEYEAREQALRSAQDTRSLLDEERRLTENYGTPRTRTRLAMDTSKLSPDELGAVTRVGDTVGRGLQTGVQGLDEGFDPISQALGEEFGFARGGMTLFRAGKPTELLTHNLPRVKEIINEVVSNYERTSVSGDPFIGELQLVRDAVNKLDEVEDIRLYEDVVGYSRPTSTSIDLPEQLARTQEVSSADPVQQMSAAQRTAQAIGYTLEDIRKSNGYQAIFGSDARNSRRIRDQLREGLLTGTGKVADAVRDRFYDKTTPVGNTNVRRKWDPSRIERLFLRDLNNLSKRPDADRWTDLIGDVEIDRIGLRDAPGRVGQVLSGARVVGQTLDPEGLLTRINRVIDEARTQSTSPDDFGAVLQEMLPGVDPMGLYLLGLNAVEKARGLPDNSLTSALGDYVGMDRFGDTNRRAQAALRGTDFDLQDAQSARFRIPDEELSVDLSALPEDAQNLFYGAAEQYRRDLAAGREPNLIEEGVIPAVGTRAGLAPDQPTQFPTALEDLPLDNSWATRLRAAEKNVDLQRRTVDEITERLEELQASGRPLTVQRKGVDLDYQPRKDPETGDVSLEPTKASMQRAMYRTQTGKAVDRLRKRSIRERAKLQTVTRQLEELEAQALVDPVNAPVTARNLLTYATRVAPEQARQLRAMAEQGVGDASAYLQLADELDAIPKTLEDLNSSEVYLAYLKDVKDRTVEGDTGPRMGSSRQAVNTRRPAGTRRRGNETDIDYSRDFRARAYWQDSEFQSWFMARQADEFVRSQGLAKSGTTRLKEAGYTEKQIGDMTPNQIQQSLERLGLRVYQPDQLFGSGRKPSANQSPLEAQWITPFAEQNLLGAIDQPGALERILAEGIYDPVIRSWKVFALPLRLGWQVNNLAGSALMTTLVGQVSPFDYPSLMRASWNAVHDWNRGVTNQVRVPLTDTYRANLVAALQKADGDQAAAIQNMLDENAIILSNEVLNEISSSGLTRGDFAWLNNSQFLRDIGAGANRNLFQQFDVEIPEVPGRIAERGRNLRQTGREVVDLAYHVNETVDNLHRTMVYLDQIGKGVTHAEAMTQVVKTLGDYNKLNGFERRVIKRIYPFYPWMRHITEVVASSMAPDNITRSLIFTNLTNIFGSPNEWEEMLPEWASGHIYMGQDENDTPRFLATRGLNPFLDVFDPVAQPNMRGLLRPSNPFIQLGYEQMSGTSVLTGRPFSSPGQAFGVTSDDPPTPPLGEYLFRNVPQLGAARDVYRDLMGQPLTRYGTGEAAFFEGAEEGRSSVQDLQQLFGYNVRPLDVQKMREREMIRELRTAEAQARYEEQLEQQGGRQARDLLNALPGLGG